MALRTRRAVLDLETGIKTQEIMSASRRLALVTGIAPPPNKAIVGKNAFAHEAGIHVQGVYANPLTYEIMKPEDIGLASNQIILGKHSGKAAVAKVIEKLGYQVSDDELKEIMERFKALADVKKEIFEADIEALIAEVVLKISSRIKFLAVSVICGNVNQPNVTVSLEVDGEKKQLVGQGCGPIDALFGAFKTIPGHESVSLVNFSLEAITAGSDAQARVHLVLKEEDKNISALGVDGDIIVASARAYVEALNRLELVKLANGRKQS